ncbi:uncharacterized protein LOC127722241 isoform X3 [Mytilus californianus]|uniref:uncharacterized protein LOC127722241 isoform X3 n=1 Tax=Mytilus californianus TaxID=6549 RepID=UPI00224750A6|nr:uncharacterized protein LOC127722241 isoform X3 [Mytilus californianus]
MISSRSRSLYDRRGERKVYPVARAGTLIYKSQREESIQRFSEMQNTSPDPQTPVPDYEEGTVDSQETYEKYCSFAKNFGSVINNIKLIDDQYDIPEPEPDYNDVVDSGEGLQGNGEPVIIRARGPSETEKRLSDPDIENNELIKPRKLSNPCVDSRERMALHKELLRNYKIGKNVLEKPELSKVLDQRKEKQRREEWDAQMKAAQKRSSFEYKLEQQATRLKEQEDLTMKPIKEEGNQTELSKIQAKILSKTANGQVK